MRTRSLGLVLCAGLALSACATIHSPKYGWKHDPPDASACADWRWIGIKESSSAACPVPGPGWTVKPLFEVATKASECCSERCKEVQGEQQKHDQNGIDTADAFDQLERFCAYETADPWKTPRQPPFTLPQAAGLVRLDRDCATILPASHELEKEDLLNLSTRFLHDAGAPMAMEITKQRGVRLAFLDTEPTGEVVPPMPGKARHGYTLAHLANRLVCSPGQPNDCAAQITTRLAMPIVEFDPHLRSDTDIDAVNGGGIGLQSHLAQAIRAEVDDWQGELLAAAMAPPETRPRVPQHLVLNLSLGWDPQQRQNLDALQLAELDAGTQAIYEALQYAKSFDVLVLAAAGNKSNCPTEREEPLLPAAWESGAPMDRSPTSETPLVYAVGGVGHDNKPLYNARSKGMPQRVAYGENGVLAAGQGDDFRSTWIYTGSSVATAVVSSTAALVWDSLSDDSLPAPSFAPVFSSAEVMNRVYASGELLAAELVDGDHRRADFWYGDDSAGDSAPYIRKISVCKALQTACGATPGSACVDGLTGCPQADALRAPDMVVAHYEPQPSSSYCHPWVIPQPDDPLCPLCSPPYRF